MIKKLLKKQTFTEEDFLKELLNPVFSQENLEERFNKNIDLNKTNARGETYLHLCAKKGCLESVKWLLENKVDIEAINEELETPLFYAALSNNGPITRFFITQGANIEHLNIHKRTVLQEALIAGKRTIKTLFDHTKNLNNADIHGNNLVFDAVSNGSKDLIEQVIQNKSIDINKVNEEGNTILHKEVVLKNNDLAMRLMEEGADPTILDKNGKNFLFYAISKGIENEAVLNKAIELGCDINSKDSNNRNILMQSVQNYLELDSDEKAMKESHLKMIKKLIKEGIQVDAVDNKKETIFFTAIRSLDEELIELFIKHDSIHINDQNIDGETVLLDCVLHGIKASKYINALLKAGADVNLSDNKGATIIEKLIDAILHFYNRKKIDDKLLEKVKNSADYLDVLRLILNSEKADLCKLNSKGQPLFFDPIIYFNYELFKILRNYGININLKDKDGHNIIFYLMEYSEHSPAYNQKLYLETLQNLINIGVEIDTKDLNGNSLLHKAVNEKCEYTVKLLLDSKPDVFAKDEKGRTLIHNAIWKDDLRYFKLIHNHDENIINQADKFGVLPINYAAFMGKVDLVKIMLEEGAHVNNTNIISPKMIEFFSKFHDNIRNLEKFAENKIEEQNLKLLSSSMKKEFNIK